MVRRHSTLQALAIVLAAALGLGLATAAQAAFEVTPSGYWTFDGNEPWADSLGNGNNASSIFSPVTVAGQVGGATGAQELDGTDDAPANYDNIVIAEGANGVFDMATGAEFTIEFWMKSSADPADLPFAEVQAIVSRQEVAGTFTSATWWIGLNASGNAAAYFVDADGMSPNKFEELTGSTVLVDGGWHHIAVTRTFTDDMGTVTDNTFRLYVDGELQDTIDDTDSNRATGSFDFSDFLHIGDIRDDFFYQGAIDNLAIYNSTALTANQVLNNFARGVNNDELDALLAPTFLGDGSGTAIVGYESSFQVTAGGDPTPTYASSDLPDGAEITSGGLITWLPNDGQTGANDFTVTATNDEGTADQSWTLTVEDLCTSAIDVYWRLDETDPSGGAEDYTGSVADSTCSTCPASAAGKVGTAYDFSGGDAEVSIASDTVFDFPAGSDFSFELWMNLAAPPGGANNQVMIGRWVDAETNWFVGVTPAGNPVVSLGDSDGGPGAFVPPITGTTDIADGDWHHIVVVRKGGDDTLTIYVDGEVDQEIDQSTDVYTDSSFEMVAPVTIGGLSGAGATFFFAGLVDEVAVYNEALSETAIAAHFATSSDQYYCHEGPVITEPSTTATVGVAYSPTLEATDAENHPVVGWFLIGTVPTGMTIDESTGEISWTPSAAGDVDVMVEAVDEYGATGQLSYTITVGAAANAVPVITGQETLETPIDTALTITLGDLTVTDSDNNYPADFTLTVQDGDNYSVSGTTITPASGFSGNLTVPVTVNDGSNDSAVFNLAVRVAAGVNARPVITSDATATATVGEAFDYTGTATDADGDTLTWSVSGVPTGMEIDDATGEVSWTPAAADEGEVTFTLSVSDGNGGEADALITITVSAAGSGGGGGGGGGCFINATAGAQTGNGLLMMAAGLLGVLGIVRQRF